MAFSSGVATLWRGVLRSVICSSITLNVSFMTGLSPFKGGLVRTSLTVFAAKGADGGSGAELDLCGSFGKAASISAPTGVGSMSGSLGCRDACGVVSPLNPTSLSDVGDIGDTGDMDDTGNIGDIGGVTTSVVGTTSWVAYRSSESTAVDGRTCFRTGIFGVAAV
jgi:hypothetical protein